MLWPGVCQSVRNTGIAASELIIKQYQRWLVACGLLFSHTKEDDEILMGLLQTGTSYTRGIKNAIFDQYLTVS